MHWPTDILHLIALFSRDLDYLNMRLMVRNIPGDIITKYRYMSTEKIRQPKVDHFRMDRHGFARRVNPVYVLKEDITKMSPMMKYMYTDDYSHHDMCPESSYLFCLSNQHLIHTYAVNVVCSDPRWAAMYCIHIRGKRMKSIEHVIMKNTKYALMYATHFQIYSSEIDHMIVNIRSDDADEYRENRKIRSRVKYFCNFCYGYLECAKIFPNIAFVFGYACICIVALCVAGVPAAIIFAVCYSLR